MASIFTPIINFFRFEPTVYSHRHHTIEIIASEKNIDLDSIKNDVRDNLTNEGRVEAILKLQKRFHVPLAIAWNFVDKLDNE